MLAPGDRPAVIYPVPKLEFINGCSHVWLFHIVSSIYPSVACCVNLFAYIGFSKFFSLVIAQSLWYLPFV